MNKTVDLDIYRLTSLDKINKFIPYDMMHHSYFEHFDKVMLSKYGMLFDRTKITYIIIDESKFSLFMLEYPEYIKKISYE